MKRQLNLFFHALQFYSRIPVGKIDYSEENLTQSVRYFPLVGIIVGAAGGGVFALSALVFPQAVAVLAALAVMVALTGALHEDGVSDFFDGFGGGYTRERILDIMKDSRVGAYGVIALIFLFAAKMGLLLSINAGKLPVAIIAAQAVSRFTPVVMMRCSTYTRAENSKSAHSRRPLSSGSIAVAFLFGILPLFFLPWTVAAVLLPVYALLVWGLKRYVEKKIGGFTGDILGALQQFSEIAFYLVYVALTA